MLSTGTQPRSKSEWAMAPDEVEIRWPSTSTRVCSLDMPRTLMPRRDMPTPLNCRLSEPRRASCRSRTGRRRRSSAVISETLAGASRSLRSVVVALTTVGSRSTGAASARQGNR